MVNQNADTNTLTARDAARIARGLKRAVSRPSAMRELLLDLPPADIDVLRGVIRLVEKRGDDAGKLATV